MSESAKSRCILPWIQVATKPNGEFRLCCYSDFTVSPSEKSQLPRRDLSSYKNFQNILESSDLKNVREKMALNQKISECDFCNQKEELGLMSKRMLENVRWSHVDPETVSLKSLDLRMHNTCNLNCIMCSPQFSSKWTSTSKKMQSEVQETSCKTFLHSTMLDRNSQKTSSKNFLNEINFSELEQVQFAGGEPLLQHEYKEFVLRLVKENRSRNISLKYNTNLTELDSDLLKAWVQFKEVHLMVSLDGFEQANDFIRAPSHWNKVISHLDLLSTFSSDFKISVITTVQALNVCSLHFLSDWIKQRYGQKIKHDYNILLNPHFLSIAILPNHMKTVAIKNLQYLLSESATQSKMDYYSSPLCYGIEIIENSEFKVSDWNAFRDYVQAYSKVNKLEYLNIFPEISFEN